MHLVALIILVPGRASNSATVSSYEGFRFCVFSTFVADGLKRCTFLH